MHALKGYSDMVKKDILSFTYNELLTEITAMKEPKFRAGQIYDWLHARTVCSFDEMTNLSKDLRRKLDDYYYIAGAQIERKLVSSIDETVKYLFRLRDGEFVEAVVMKYKYGSTICVSSQVGCRMGCKFCASTLNGEVRSLTASEILAQVYTAQHDTGEKMSHVVLMGMGEPLDNYDNVMRFISLITNEKGQNMSMRHISLSTCGIVPKIYELMDLDLQLTLSVSLHAPNDEIRSSMMPINRKYPISELLCACKKYTDKTRRRISFEYAMVRGVNDSDACANELCSRLRGILCHVNLIPVNEVKETACKRSSAESIKRFSDILTSHGYTVTVRRELGSDINASCGQLRRSVEKDKNKGVTQ